MQSNILAPKLLKSKAAAEALGISERTLWGLMKSGELLCVRIGRAVRFDARDLLAFIEKKKGGAV